MTSTSRRLRRQACAAGAALAVAACGGGGGEAPVPPPSTTTLSGEVTRIGALRNVVVCLDLNGNDACDGAEPASAPTGADGRYTLAYDPAALPQAAAAPLIAAVKAGDPAAPGTAMDAATPGLAATDADYVLRRPAGAGGAINPLTTLVQAGVVAGMAEAEARGNAALQLAIDAAKIDAYQDDPAWDEAQLHDTARTAAALIAEMLRLGVPLVLGEQHAAADADTLLANLYFQDAGNFFVQTFETQAKAAGAPCTTLLDRRSGKTGGVSRPDGNDPNALYRSAYLSPQGWQWCGPTVPIELTVGNPNRARVCGTRVQLGWNRANDIADQDMATYVAAHQNTFNVVPAADLLAGSAFPAGAQQRRSSAWLLAPEIQIDNFYTRAQPGSRRTLEAVVEAFPSAAATVPTGANTLSLALSSSAQRALRVSFAPADANHGTAHYYECDLNAEQTVVSNCAASATGGYRIETLNGQRLLRFSGQPPTPALGYHVVYAQLRWNADDPDSQWVYRAHETKPGLGARSTSATRLNGTAWAAMKARLGL